MQTAEERLDQLFYHLKNTPEGSFHNPWFDYDQEHDASENGYRIRYQQLRAYLSERLDSAKYLFIAEALGYQGGHFSGIAMTSERILMGYHREKHNISPGDVFKSIAPKRTSKKSIIAKGFTEPTATIVWKALARMEINPFEVVLWNALSWHPYDPEKGMLSNRTPSDGEMESGYPALRAFLKLFPGCKVVAVGRKAEQALKNLSISFTGVRHPANGGAGKFRRQLTQLVS